MAGSGTTQRFSESRESLHRQGCVRCSGRKFYQRRSAHATHHSRDGRTEHRAGLCRLKVLGKELGQAWSAVIDGWVEGSDGGNVYVVEVELGSNAAMLCQVNATVT